MTVLVDTKPTEAADIRKVQRAYRAADVIEGQGYSLKTPLPVYPRSVDVEVSPAGHWAHVAPTETGVWRVRVIAPDGREVGMNLTTSDASIGHALRHLLNEQNVRREVGLI